jgi:hypothetical protein
LFEKDEKFFNRLYTKASFPNRAFPLPELSAYELDYPPVLLGPPSLDANGLPEAKVHSL